MMITVSYYYIISYLHYRTRNGKVVSQVLVCLLLFAPATFKSPNCLNLPDGRARKRRRTSDAVDIEDRLESLITRVGEKVKYSVN